MSIICSKGTPSVCLSMACFVNTGFVGGDFHTLNLNPSDLKPNKHGWNENHGFMYYDRKASDRKIFCSCFITEEKQFLSVQKIFFCSSTEEK